MWFRKKKTKPKNVLKLWGIIEGPFHREEVEGEEDNDQEWMLLMKISKGEEVSESQIWFDTFQDVYQIRRYFEKNIEPLELEISSD
jgi:hypothetical protein